MTVAVAPDKLERFLSLAKKMGVLATPLGKFTDSGYFHVLYNGKTVALLPLTFLHDGVPQLNLKAEWKKGSWEEKVSVPYPQDFNEILKRLLKKL